MWTYLPIGEEALMAFRAMLPEENFFACCSTPFDSLSVGVVGNETPLQEQDTWMTKLSGVGWADKKAGSPGATLHLLASPLFTAGAVAGFSPKL